MDVRVALVPAPARRVGETLHEAGDVRRLGEIGGHRDEQWTAVLHLRKGVDPRAPGRERRAVRSLLAGLRPHRLRVALVVADALVLEDVLRAAAEEERRDLIRDRAGDLHQAIGEVVAHVAPRVEHGGGDLEVPARLRAHGRPVLRCLLVHAFVFDAVFLLKFLAQLPEELAVHRVRGPMRRVVVLEVAAALARAEPADARNALRIVATRGFEHDLRDVVPLAALFGADDAPAVRLEPVARSAVHDARHRIHVDAEVVPVEKEHQVRKTQAPGRVAGLVARARREPAFALDREHFDLLGARDLQRDGLADRRRHTVAGRSGVPLEEQRLAGHLRMTG